MNPLASCLTAEQNVKFSFFLSFPRPPATLCVAMRAGKRESRNFKLYIVIFPFSFFIYFHNPQSPYIAPRPPYLNNAF
jgi:hypothetical protein